ncbi:hypothetical protein ILUMI_10136 [Ignelater luminosus]|uniref:MICOS complex subunit n=1 Tax=Ignelater luminosus TaxID=2038154 RepID=A0A8K0D3U9_IGNLU|nr:hypothetical protein ILUMI_10136 [Ignelater luminosus]
MHRLICYQVVRYVFIPAAALVAEKSKASTADCVCKPSELPIYSTKESNVQISEPCPPPPGGIEQAFGTIRRSIFSMLAELKSLEKAGEDYFHMGLENTEHLISYLQQEDNTTPKYGAIAVGGIAGLIFGLRGGFFKRTIYASTGALGMAALCYPKEAAEYSQIGITEAKRYATIAYNFVNGDAGLDDEDDENKKVLEINALGVVTEAHDIATTTSCHCPIGACMGHHEEPPPPESQLQEILLVEPTEGNAESEKGPGTC